MTNRRKLLTELEALPSAELFDVLSQRDLVGALEDMCCKDCAAEHLAECVVNECTFPVDRWLELPCKRESILKEVLPE